MIKRKKSSLKNYFLSGVATLALSVLLSSIWGNVDVNASVLNEGTIESNFGFADDKDVSTVDKDNHKHGFYCEECSEFINPAHVYNDEFMCMICGEECKHYFVIGKCIYCGNTCKHIDENEDMNCDICGFRYSRLATTKYISSTEWVNDREKGEFLIDGDRSTKWCHSHSNFNGDELIFELENPEVATAYTLVTGNDTKTYTGRNWYSWKLYGTNDIEGEWNVIDEHDNYDGLPTGNFEIKKFEFENTKPYKYYKISISAIVSGNIMQMSEFELETREMCQEHDAPDGICRVCGEILHSHKDNIQLVSYVEPTCAEDGHIDYYACECGKIYLDSTCNNIINDDNYCILPATGNHNYIKKDTNDKYLEAPANYVSPAIYKYACDVCGKKGEETYTYGKKITLKMPIISKCVAVEEGISIKWNSVDYAEKYRIYRKDENGKWLKLKDIASTNFIDKNVISGHEYTYTVRCITSDGKITISDYDKKGYSVTFCDVPLIKNVNSVSNGVKITWYMIDGAETYRIYRKTIDGNWKSIGYSDTLSYIDTTAVSGVEYYYTVRCMDINKEIFTSAYDKIGKNVFYISEPILKSAVPVIDGVKIAWGRVSGAKMYRVFRKVEGGTWKKIADTISTDYIDSKVISGSKYYYTVRCIDDNTKETISTYNIDGVNVYYCNAPKLLKANITKTGIKISWDNSEGAELYRVYRKTVDGSWKKVGDTKSTSFTDKNVIKGETYYYTVKCIDNTKTVSTSAYDPNGIMIIYK